MALANTTRDKKERAGRMYLMHAADREEIKEAFAGDIVALQGLKDTRTGETLCDPSKPVSVCVVTVTLSADSFESVIT